MESTEGVESSEQRFKSRGETQLARLLDRYRVPYLYEHPLAVVDDKKTRIWYPDFQLRGYGIVMEYCGLPDKPAYAAGMARKEAVYRANGLTALMLTPDDLRGRWPTRVLGQIEYLLEARLRAFREGQTGGRVARENLRTRSDGAARVYCGDPRDDRFYEVVLKTQRVI